MAPARGQRNTGFTYISGTPMGADTIYLPRAVAPGDTIDLSLQMTAPDIEEDYSNFWRLRNTAGEIFGTVFFVAIEVSKDYRGAHPHRNRSRQIHPCGVGMIIPGAGQ